MAKNKLSILDKIASVSEDIKEEIQETVATEEVQEKVTIGRKIDNAILHFEIKDDDDEFLLFIKEEINKAQITKEELYAIYDRGEAYNMIYTLNNGVITLQKIKKWLDALGKELILTTRDISE